MKKCQRWVRRVVVASVALSITGLANATPVNYQMVTVGDAGNASDVTGFGTVSYAYRMGQHEVTVAQYAAFLNAVDPNGLNQYGLYDSEMENDRNTAGIALDYSSSPGARYSVMMNGGFSGNRPVTFVSWFDAARFSNWMHNGQGSGSTETGAYSLGGATAGPAIAKNPGAKYYIPTENEWYKAAYYSPLLNGASGGYHSYATQSDGLPGNVVGGAFNQANFARGWLYSVTQSSAWDPNQNYLTDVGAFTSSQSYYGTFDQVGNVFELNDLDGSAGPQRGLRGGSWKSPFFFTSADRNILYATDVGTNTFGFRLAGSVPVPEIDPAGLGSVFALVTGALGILERRRRAGQADAGRRRQAQATARGGGVLMPGATIGPGGGTGPWDRADPGVNGPVAA